jgi:hypothetical protein
MAAFFSLQLMSAAVEASARRRRIGVFMVG